MIKAIGKKYGRLTVIDILFKYDGKRTFYKCLCECGKEKIINSDAVRRGKTKSCGCYNKDVILQRSKYHGISKSRLYQNYYLMINRCNNSNCPHFKDYGGRGIKICDEWLGENGFINFYNWAMANGYKEEKLPNGRNKWSIERKNNNGNYEPSNCRWATYAEQANNKRNNVYITYNGETLNIAAIVKKYNVIYNRFRTRIARGWDIEKALTTPSLRKEQ